MNESLWVAMRAWGRGESLVEEYVSSLSKLEGSFSFQERSDEIEILRRRYLRQTHLAQGSMRRNEALIGVVADLARQGWEFKSAKGTLWGLEPVETGRDQRRRQLHAQRVEQLRKPSVQAFIRGMERRQLRGGLASSIFSLMRDGRELAVSLEAVNAGRKVLREAISPYLEFVITDRRCDHTGILLTDIWRYFRHTWSSPYQSIPGRSILFLVRDAAAPGHPVMGIGQLSSAAVKLRGRDDDLGWEAESVLKKFEMGATKREIIWLESLVEDRLGEIYKLDLIEDEVLTLDDIKNPTDDVLERLFLEARDRRAQHHGMMAASEHKSTTLPARLPEEEWEQQALTPLFRSKRAKSLADLLSARRVLQHGLKLGSTKNALKYLMGSKDGKRAVSSLVKLARSKVVGTAIADLTVCGAIPPYNPLLVGKLVAMLAASPAVVQEYRRRYKDQPSVIASSMAGRPVKREADLVFIGTTSLYGERPCQYDRVAVPSKILGKNSRNSIRYRFVCYTVGWGSYQFSDSTTQAVLDYLNAEASGQRVNYVFGEGASPKFRGLREGLCALGFDENRLLRHGQKKAFYGVKLVDNLSEYLLGRTKRPRYLFSLREPSNSTEEIVRWWGERWLAKRLDRTGVFEQVRRHTLVHPIEHGARVRLPREDVEQQDLFS